MPIIECHSGEATIGLSEDLCEGCYSEKGTLQNLASGRSEPERLCETCLWRQLKSMTKGKIRGRLAKRMGLLSKSRRV